MLDPRTGEVLALASTPDLRRLGDRQPGNRGPTASTRSADNPDQPLLTRPTQGRYVPGSVFKIVTAIAGLGLGRDRPGHDVPGPGAGREGRPGRRRLPGPTSTAAFRRGRSTSRGDRGLVQHLVRARRPRDRRREPRRITPGGSGSAARSRSTCRPPSRRSPTAAVRRRRVQATTSSSRTRPTARARARHAAPDGARGGDRRERRRADAAAPRDGADRQGGDPRRSDPKRFGRVISAADADAITAAMRRGGRGRPRPPVHGRREGARHPDGRQVRHGRARRPGEPHSWFIGFAPADNPQVAIAVLVERGGRGGARRRRSPARS